MNNEKIIGILRKHYFAMLAVLLIMVLTCEFGFKEPLPVVTPTAMYIIQVFAVMFTVALIPFAVVGFTKAMEKAKGLSRDAFVVKFLQKSMRRVNLLVTVVAVNVLVYYRLGYDGALYCGLLGLGAMIYSFPVKNVLEQYLKGPEK